MKNFDKDAAQRGQDEAYARLPEAVDLTRDVNGGFGTVVVVMRV
jgi:hypothetical protein